ncbi:MAG TPA: sulfotransferase [Acidimicrobiales bacterium]|nr:sulfotransferase [Acidimicrobiales bacterium]
MPSEEPEDLPTVEYPVGGPAPTPLLVSLLEGRSGSTVLMALLGTSSEILFDRDYPYEHRYLTYLVRLLSRVGAPRDPSYTMDHVIRGEGYVIPPLPFDPASIDAASLHRRLISAGWEALAAELGERSGWVGRYYAEKAWPGASWALRNAGVSPRIIHLVRDPRDIVASIRAFDAKRGYYGFGRKPGESDDDYLKSVTTSMAGSLERMRFEKENFDCRVVRYEDLVGDTASVAADLSAWLGVTLDPTRRDELDKHLPEHATAASAEQSIGRFKTDLRWDEAAFVAGALAAQMRSYGYDLITDVPAT